MKSNLFSVSVFPVILLLSFGSCAQEITKSEKQERLSTANELPVLDPKIGYTVDISESAKQKFLKEQMLYNVLVERRAQYEEYEEFEKHSTKAERDILMDEEKYGKESVLDISVWGCSWYCGGGPSEVYSSSTLASTVKNNYSASNIHDANLGTAWVEGKPGLGIGESFSFVFEKKSPPVTSATFYNGYMKSDQIWKDNARVKQLKLYVDDKPFALLNFKDIKSQQTFYIDTLQGVDTSLVLRFEITQVYKGDKYEDVAISDIEFDGTGVHCFAKGTKVLTPSGNTMIEQLKVGDEILTWNEQLRVTETAIVLEMATQKHHNLYELDFGGTKIIVTDDHPFFANEQFYAVKPNSTYGIKASELTVGQELRMLENGVMVPKKLISMHKLESCQETYTITKMNKNRLFFANGMCVVVEELSDSPLGQILESNSVYPK